MCFFRIIGYFGIRARFSANFVAPVTPWDLGVFWDCGSLESGRFWGLGLLGILAFLGACGLLGYESFSGYWNLRPWAIF